jgi:hypothetical protein
MYKSCLLRDLSILQKLPNLQFVRFIGNGYFYRRYWASFDEWHPLWLSDREEEKISDRVKTKLG